MKQDGGDRTETIDPAVAVAEEEGGLSCRAQQKLETSGEKPRPKLRKKASVYTDNSHLSTHPQLCAKA